MKLTKYDKQAIVKAIMNDVPKPDKSKRRTDMQAALVKAMSPEVRKVFKTAPGALRTKYIGNTIYDGSDGGSDLITGDVPQKTIDALLEPYIKEDEVRRAAERKLRGAVEACTTLKQLNDRLPEFKKYFPTAPATSANLPALTNVVADLSTLGWPKGAQ